MMLSENNRVFDKSIDYENVDDLGVAVVSTICYLSAGTEVDSW